MSKRIEYLKGQKVGKCFYLNDIGTGWHRKAMFKCGCGKEFIAVIIEVKNLHTKSCGCQRYNGAFIHGHASNGQSSEYKAWHGMKDRCFNINKKSYKDYGGRGITVCDRWNNSFENFLADMGTKPSPRHSIDRINNNGNYEPSNCRWATKIEQARNTRRNVLLTFNSETLCVSEWTKKMSMKGSVLYNRLKQGWPVEKALRPIT